MDDRRTDLRFDVVADDRKPRLPEAPGPRRVRGYEHRNGVDESHPSFEGCPGIKLGRLFRANRHVANQNIRFRLAQSLRYIHRLGGGFIHHVLVVEAEPVKSRPSLHLDTQVAYVGKANRVVLSRPHRLCQVLADLGCVDVESGHEINVAYVISAEVDMHQARYQLVRIGIPVVLDALDQGVGTVADSRDRHAYSAHFHSFLAQISLGSGCAAAPRRFRGRGLAARSFSISSSSHAMSASVDLRLRRINAMV